MSPSTQAGYDLKLTSMQLPEVDAKVSFTLEEAQQESFTNTLLLYPGRPSAIKMQLKNVNWPAFRWMAEVEGDFPKEWCMWQQQEAEELAIQEECDRDLHFQVPTNFFEELLALKPDRPQLKLNFQLKISVFEQGGEQREMIGSQNFNLIVRPYPSYLKFLPALYQEVDFVGRFLAIFEQTFDPIVQTMDMLWAYLDPLTAPEAFLPFLARWVAWDLDEHLTLHQQRRLIKNAITLYRWHGTRQGLRFYLHLYTGLPLDDHIAVEEVFSAGFVMDKTLIGQDSMLGGGRPYHFIVRLRPQEHTRIDEIQIRKIIEKQKPAFCTYELQILPHLESI